MVKVLFWINDDDQPPAGKQVGRGGGSAEAEAEEQTRRRAQQVSVVLIWAHSDGGGENRSAEGNKVLKYVLVHGRQWVWAMVVLGVAVLRY
eukprot:15366758-Ditylum_brightwellii.AAC.1